MANKAKAIWAAGKVVLNGWLAIPSGFSAEAMAQCGFDSVTVDLQHGVQDYMSMVQCFQAMQAHPVTPMVRVPWNEPGIIGKVLDAGAYGVIAPMINSKAECEAFVSACKYPPRGQRSNGPVRVGFYGGGSYQKTANEDTLCIPMIETREAVANLDAILDVDGIAAAYIGPSDLGFSHGLAPTLDNTDPGILAVYDKVIAACEKRGIPAGIHCSGSAGAITAIARGFRFVTVVTDVSAMSAFSRNAVTQTRQESQGRA
jgi:4-hydroxy-2-oxoheptanedioate aldolase